MSDENVFIHEFLEKLGLGKAPAAETYAAQVQRVRAYTDQIRQGSNIYRANGLQQLVNDARDSLTGTNIRMLDEATGEITDFDFQQPTTRMIDGKEYLSYKELTYSKSIQPNILERFSMSSASPFTPEAIQPTDSIRSWGGSRPIPGTEGGVSVPCRRGLGRRVCTTIHPPSLETDVALARQGEKLLTMSVVSQQAAHYLNELVRVAAVAFCVIDFIEGQYIAGVLGLIGVAAASIIPLLMAGPMGILFGTALALLFFILPGVFQTLPAPPSIESNVEIIQYAFFGDKDHTGNEKCAQQHPGCVASYGPGILALTFKWELYDAVAFLIWANHGFPMTIPDIAAAFKRAISFDKDQNITAAAAKVTCGNYVGSHLVSNRWGTTSWSGFDPNKCNFPKFHFDRTLVTLPNVNRTAAEVYNDIIGGSNDGGSCKIINNADNMVTIPDYGIRIKGLPVAIACGLNQTVSGENIVSGPDAVKTPIAGQHLTSSLKPVSTAAPSEGDVSSTISSITTVSSNLSGFLTLNAPTAIPAGSSPSSIPSGSSPGTLSTDGRSGEGYIPPPPPAPFQNSLTRANSACFTTTILPNDFCLPNGTYTGQSGTFVFTTQKVNGVYFPAGSSLIIHGAYPSLHYPHPFTKSYKTNVTTGAKNQDLDRSMDHMTTFDVLISDPPPPPVACLFTHAKYTGDVTCVGTGGGNMTAGRGQVGSVAIYGGATVTLYPNGYGDRASQTFTVSVDDLATVPYGTNGNLKGNVTAVLVEAPANLGGSTSTE